MSTRTVSLLRVVLYEGPGSEPLSAAERLRYLGALLDKGYSVTASNRGEPLDLAREARCLVLGRFTKPVEDRDVAEGAVRFRELGTAAAAEVAGWVDQERGELAQPGAWKPWFPVIDYDRCTNCMQCLSFCLFGVYGVDGDQKIQVQNNDQCKTNCPACSRVCPEAAIMFPKYKAGPINGDVVSDADLKREKMKVDISALLGGDIYQMLRDRSERAKSRFSKERDSDKALKERQRCLTALAKAGDIPAEVLMSLPSPDEIARRAEEAKAKAAAALAAQEPRSGNGRTS